MSSNFQRRDYFRLISSIQLYSHDLFLFSSDCLVNFFIESVSLFLDCCLSIFTNILRKTLFLVFLMSVNHISTSVTDTYFCSLTSSFSLPSSD